MSVNHRAFVLPAINHYASGSIESVTAKVVNLLRSSPGYQVAIHVAEGGTKSYESLLLWRDTEAWHVRPRANVHRINSSLQAKVDRLEADVTAVMRNAGIEPRIHPMKE